jgi:hypothetical protein
MHQACDMHDEGLAAKRIRFPYTVLRLPTNDNDVVNLNVSRPLEIICQSGTRHAESSLETEIAPHAVHTQVLT